MKKWDDLSKSSRMKVEKIFEAVIALLEEGADSHAIKVVDITNRAGIGKGTAYEYFESREEIIAAALEYDMSRQFTRLNDIMAKEKDFHGMVDAAFTWLEKHLRSKGSGIEFFKAKENSFDVERAVAVRCQSFDYVESNMKKMLNMQIQRAVESGIWKESSDDFFAESALLSAYVEYFMYLFHRKKHTTVSQRQMREFIYDGLVNRLAHFDCPMV